MTRRRRIKLICRWAGVVTLVLWGMSFWRSLVFVWDTRPDPSLHLPRWPQVKRVGAWKGILFFDDGCRTNREPGFHTSGYSDDNFRPALRTFLIGEIRPATQTESLFVIAIPATVPLTLSAALIGFSFWRRYPKGHCARCGYDLKGIADQCPECGRMVQAEAP